MIYKHFKCKNGLFRIVLHFLFNLIEHSELLKTNKTKCHYVYKLVNADHLCEWICIRPYLHLLVGMLPDVMGKESNHVAISCSSKQNTCLISTSYYHFLCQKIKKSAISQKN